jgi:hypothetical protein
MGGGGKSKNSAVKAPVFDTDPSHYRNSGYNQTMNPFTAQGKPSWMQGNFAMDTWGKSAADPRISLTQDMLSPYGMPIHDEAVKQMGQYDQQQAQGLSPQMPSWMGQVGGQPMSLEQVMMSRAPQQPQIGYGNAMKTGKAGGLPMDVARAMGSQLSPTPSQAGPA